MSEAQNVSMNRWHAFTTRELCDISHACRMLLKRQDLGSDEREPLERLANESWNAHVERNLPPPRDSGKPQA
jgi:hypothetical protein